MAKSPDSRESFAKFCASFEAYGLVVLGGLTIDASHSPSEFQHLVGCPALLIGNRGREMWSHFSNSDEFLSGVSGPLDRWTKRLLAELCDNEPCQIFHPSDKPYWAFQRIASEAQGIGVSPIGILIHPEFGLWHGLRGLLVFENTHKFMSHIKDMETKVQKLNHPCETCNDKPCMSACPVSAFTEADTLNVQKCFSHLDSNSEPRCMEEGCRARDACPIGTEYRNAPEQIRFHMKSYRGQLGN